MDWAYRLERAIRTARLGNGFYYGKVYLDSTYIKTVTYYSTVFARPR